MSVHLALLSILVPSYEEGLAFFVGKMGFDLLEDTDQGGGKRWVRIAPGGAQNGGPGGAQTAFLLAEAKGPQRDFIGKQGGGRVWLFLQTDDFAGDHARLIAAGVAFQETPRHEPYGTVAVFRDPFGNLWDLIERTQPA